MADPHLTLYHFPGACSRVTVCALEMAELPYDLKLVDLAKGEQSGPDYMAISPLGKVPLLLIDGDPMAENAAIIRYIARLRPDAGIFPRSASPRQEAEVIGGMSFCGGTIHPQIRGIANPQRVTAGDGEPVREKSRELVAKSFKYANKRLGERGWWTGELTIADVYLDWTAHVARVSGVDVTAYPRVDELRTRLLELPGYQRMQAEEERSLKALGL